MDREYFNRVVSISLLLISLVLSFILIRPILISITLGLILAFIFIPVYDIIYKKTKSPNLSASVTTIILLLLIVLLIVFFVPLIVQSLLQTYLSLQKSSFSSDIVKQILPAVSNLEKFTGDITYLFRSFLLKIFNSMLNYLSSFIFQLPSISFQLLVVFFVFYFTIRDRKELLNYISSLSPFNPELNKKLFDYTKDITVSVLYGQVIVGFIQGIIIGAGFFIFGISNAFLLTLLAVVAGIFPIIGTGIVWVPVVGYLFIKGDFPIALGLTIFGIISSFIDSFLRPLIVSKRTKIHTGLVILGMIGGFFVFGIVGFVVGPLILEYSLILLEIYRKSER